MKKYIALEITLAVLLAVFLVLTVMFGVFADYAKDHYTTANANRVPADAFELLSEQYGCEKDSCEYCNGKVLTVKAGNKPHFTEFVYYRTMITVEVISIVLLVSAAAGIVVVAVLHAKKAKTK